MTYQIEILRTTLHTVIEKLFISNHFGKELNQMFFLSPHKGFTIGEYTLLYLEILTQIVHFLHNIRAARIFGNYRNYHKFSDVMTLLYSPCFWLARTCAACCYRMRCP